MASQSLRDVTRFTICLGLVLFTASCQKTGKLSPALTARLEKEGGLQWPCPDESHPGSPFLHGRLWSEPIEGPPAPFHRVEHDPPVDRLTPKFPLRLTTGRRLDSFNTGVQTGGYASPLRFGETIDLAPEDGVSLGVAEGERVRIVSPRRRMLAWILASAPLWVVGAFAAPGPRLAWWGAAALIDTTGTWLIDNNVGMYITFAVAVGANLTASAANTWSVGNFLAAPGQINGCAATSDVFRITGVVVLPGSDAPSAARSALIMRPYPQELQICQRYYEKITGGAIFAYQAAGGYIYEHYPFKVSKRAVPTMSSSEASPSVRFVWVWRSPRSCRSTTGSGSAPSRAASTSPRSSRMVGSMYGSPSPS
jgi:hypothetical protein